MRIHTKIFGFLAALIVLAGCGHQLEKPRIGPPEPFAYLSLGACRSYRYDIVECQLEYVADFQRMRLGPVQKGDPSIESDGGRRQIDSCYPVERIQREMPDFVCRISPVRSGADAGSVLVKGGTAVRLARILGDSEQLHYRWTPDEWSRLRD